MLDILMNVRWEGERRTDFADAGIYVLGNGSRRTMPSRAVSYGVVSERYVEGVTRWASRCQTWRYAYLCDIVLH